MPCFRDPDNLIYGKSEAGGVVLGVAHLVGELGDLLHLGLELRLELRLLLLLRLHLGLVAHDLGVAGVRLALRPEPAADDGDEEGDRRARRDEGEALLVLVLAEGLDLALVLLLVLELLGARGVIGVEAGLLDLAFLDGREASRLFAYALLLRPAALFLGVEARLFLLAGSTLGIHAGLGRRVDLALAGHLFLLDAVLLEVHELLEGEEDRALFLFRHGFFLGLKLVPPIVEEGATSDGYLYEKATDFAPFAQTLRGPKGQGVL